MSTDDSPDDSAATNSDSPGSEHPMAIAPKPKGTTQSRKGGRPSEASDERKKRKPGGERRDRQGFGDGVERAACSSYRHRLPPDFPVQHRTGIAALVPRVVARRTSAVLLCDCIHEGPHYWPDGDLAEDSGN